MTARLIAGASRDVTWHESRDCGGMFHAEVGVWKDGTSFVAYVKDEWGGGANSKPHPDEPAARADIGRLWERLYGGDQ